MLKLFGVMLILFSCTVAGFSAAAVYRLREEQLDAFRSLVSYIGAQIGAFLIPLDSIYADFKNTRLESCGFLKLIRESDFETALNGCRGRIFLSNTELYEVEKFFQGLGRHDAKEEERHCAYYEKRLAQMYSAAHAEARAKIRLCRAFGFLGGLMLAVILL